MKALARAALAVLLVGGAVVAIVGVESAAQTSRPINVVPSRDTLEEAARDGCDDTSVVVQRCLDRQGDAKKASTDPIDRSNERAKAALDRQARKRREPAAGNPDDAAANPDAQRLAPVTVTGTATPAPAAPEEVIQKALNPSDPATRVLANGNTVTYDANGNRVECQAHCVGPMCCKSIRAQLDPARMSNSIGR